MPSSFVQRACLIAAAAILAAVVVAEEVRADDAPRRKVAAIVSTYYHNSHADMFVSRLLLTDTLDGQGRVPSLELASLFVDQEPVAPHVDISRKLMADHGVPICTTIEQALTLGTDRLAVDGVLLIAEHGVYPVSDTGQVIWPKRRMFEEIVRVFQATGRVVPVFIDKHLADNWEDAKWIYDTAERMNIPLMAGSSVPAAYRLPAADVARDAKLKEIVAISYHTFDAYGFHALEFAQSLAERRAGGETGIRQVRCLQGDAMWRAADEGVWDRELAQTAVRRAQRPPPEGPLKDLPYQGEIALWTIDYVDGLRVNVLALNYPVVEWSAAWRYDDGRVESTLFWTQEARPFFHFAYLLEGIERMIVTGQPAWPVERTLLTSGTLDALLISRRDGHQPLDTPYLRINYRSDWDWREPPPPPPDRPLQGQ
jgi:hypothetical protein